MVCFSLCPPPSSLPPPPFPSDSLCLYFHTMDSNARFFRYCQLNSVPKKISILSAFPSCPISFFHHFDGTWTLLCRPFCVPDRERVKEERESIEFPRKKTARPDSYSLMTSYSFIFCSSSGSPKRLILSLGLKDHLPVKSIFSCFIF